MKWYSWKLGRLAWGLNKQSHVVEGNNRWYRVFWKFFWRYDDTKAGTKE